MAIPHFSSQCNGLYRAELIGLLSIVHMVCYLCLTHNLITPSLLSTCDNIKALESCFDTPIEKINPKQKHSDILSEVFRLLQKNIIHLTYRHVSGHQDRFTMYEDLPRVSQMNIRMD